MYQRRIIIIAAMISILTRKCVSWNTFRTSVLRKASLPSLSTSLLFDPQSFLSTENARIVSTRRSYRSHPPSKINKTALKSSSKEVESNDSQFRPGSRIQVEVVSFGPLGASVDVIADSHDPDALIPETDPPLATGLILQKEISYFRQGRGGVDVVRGEVLPAYVERVRDEETELDNGLRVPKLDIALRAYGGKAKADSVSNMILQRLQDSRDGMLDVGDKSPPEDIAKVFPGVSKGSFKKAVAALYRQGKVKPGPFTVTLTE